MNFWGKQKFCRITDISLSQTQNIISMFLPSQILENEYQSGQSEDEDPEMSDAANGISRVGLNGRRRSLQTPDVNKVLSQGRRHSTGQAISYRSAVLKSPTGIDVH